MITVNIKRNRGGGDTSPLLLSRRKRMPIKLSLVTSDGSDYPYTKIHGWVETEDTINESSLSKSVVEANTETSCTVAKYFADESALETYRTVNADAITSINTKRAANSLSISRTEETVDSIP
tara:strand:+ start:313 stop:678 length:366 start_codon:yes stop_codon:yes gene_type:complete